MGKQKSTKFFEPTFDLESAVEESSIAEEEVFRRLDELTDGNTLLSALDGTLESKLTPEMFTEEDFDLIGMTVFVNEETLESNDKAKIVAELIDAMFGVAQYFRFMDARVEDDWIDVFPELVLSEDLQNLPDTELTRYIVEEARKKGMNDRELFALIQFFCIGESGTLQ